MSTVEAISAAHQPTTASGDIATSLASIDWNFSARKSHSDIEGLHPYPAKFIAELPSALLDVIPLPRGTAVFDPYCGSGTAIVECQRRGLISVGVDLNPIACLISRVKTATVPHRIIPELNTVLKNAQLRDRDVLIPPIPNLDHWFLRPVQQALAALTTEILSSTQDYRDIFQLALSSIIVRVSNQESDTRYAAIKKNICARDVYFGFQRAVQGIADTLRQRDYPLHPVRIIEADTLSLSPQTVGHRIGFVITSPP